MPVPRAARRRAIYSDVLLSRLSEAPSASLRAVSPAANRIWRHSCASLSVQPQAFAPPAACAVRPRLCRIQRPIHMHWVAITHRHGTCDSINRVVVYLFTRARLPPAETRQDWGLADGPPNGRAEQQHQYCFNIRAVIKSGRHLRSAFGVSKIRT